MSESLNADILGDIAPLASTRPEVSTVKVNTLAPMKVMFHNHAGPPISGGMICPAGLDEMRCGTAASSALRRIPNAFTVGWRTFTCSRKLQGQLWQG